MWYRPSEKEMSIRVSHWLRDQERASQIGAGTTLHGLRVSYAAWWRCNGANTRELADLIGDELECMGPTMCGTLRRSRPSSGHSTGSRTVRKA